MTNTFTARDGRSWTHRVVRLARGHDGKWFVMRGGRTFMSLELAQQNARQFAAEVSGSGSIIAVMARKAFRAESGFMIRTVEEIRT